MNSRTPTHGEEAVLVIDDGRALSSLMKAKSGLEKLRSFADRIKDAVLVMRHRPESERHYARCRNCGVRFRIPEYTNPPQEWSIQQFCSDRCARPEKFPPQGKHYEQSKTRTRQQVRRAFRLKALDEQKRFRQGEYSFNLPRRARRMMMRERGNRWFRESRSLPEPR